MTNLTITKEKHWAKGKLHGESKCQMYERMAIYNLVTGVNHCPHRSDKLTQA